MFDNELFSSSKFCLFDTANTETNNITKEVTSSSKVEKLSDDLTIVVIGK